MLNEVKLTERRTKLRNNKHISYSLVLFNMTTKGGALYPSRKVQRAPGLSYDYFYIYHIVCTYKHYEIYTSQIYFVLHDKIPLARPR